MTGHKFLPRAHSERLGKLDVSNWKNLDEKRNIDRIDPAIKEIVSLLNAKGYRTFSSCSGGHRTYPRRRFDRHESGYLAFSPPSRIAFKLYLALRKRDRDFEFEAQALVFDGHGGRNETLSTRIYWQLLDERRHNPRYYNDLFAQMKRLIHTLPKSKRGYSELIASLLGRKEARVGQGIVSRQMKRFSKSELA